MPATLLSSKLDLVAEAEVFVTFFAKYNMRKRVCSATQTALASGTFARKIDFDVQ